MDVVVELLPVTLAAALASGALRSLVIGVPEPLVGHLGVDQRTLRRLLSVLRVALVLSFPLAGAFADHTGAEQGVIVGMLMAALGLALLAVRDNQTVALISMMLTAAGTAFVNAAAAVLFVHAFLPGKPVAAMNLGYVAVAVAWLAAPPLVDRLIRAVDVRRALLLLALGCVAVATVAALTPVAHFPNPEHGDLGSVFESPAIWLVGLATLLYLPVEGAMVRWTTGQLPGQGHSARGAAWLLGAFWVAFLLGRVLAALALAGPVVPTGREAWLIVLLGVCVAVGIGNLAGAGPRSSLGVGLVLIGLFCGPIYPTLLGSVMRQFPREPGTAFAIAAAVGTLGSALVPLAQRDVQPGSVPRAMRLPLVSALAIAAVALVWGLVR